MKAVVLSSASVELNASFLSVVNEGEDFLSPGKSGIELVLLSGKVELTVALRSTAVGVEVSLLLDTLE